MSNPYGRNLKGVVKDTDGKLSYGAKVFITTLEGEKVYPKGAITDVDGSFSIYLPPDSFVTPENDKKYLTAFSPTSSAKTSVFIKKDKTDYPINLAYGQNINLTEVKVVGKKKKSIPDKKKNKALPFIIGGVLLVLIIGVGMYLKNKK